MGQNLSDEEIGALWAEHFPRRNKDAKSKTLLLSFSTVIEDRAQNIVLSGDLSDKVHHVCDKIGIPVAEFEQFREERVRGVN
jgi:hypothetical protein